VLQSLHCAIGRAATNTLLARAATWHATAAPPAVRPFATSWIVNANGSLATPQMGGRGGPSSTKPHAGAAFCSKAASPTRRRLGHLHGNRSPQAAPVVNYRVGVCALVCWSRLFYP